jgi:hypothetical protein
MSSTGCGCSPRFSLGDWYVSKAGEIPYIPEKTPLALSNLYVSKPPSTVGGVEFDDGESRDKALGPNSLTPDAALSKLGTNATECSESVNRRPGEPCSSSKVVNAMREFAKVAKKSSASGGKTAPRGGTPETLPQGGTSEAKAVRKAAAVLGCSSESCVVMHPNFRDFAEKKTTSATVPVKVLLNVELERRFKPKGPRNSTSLLSNHNIDGVLRRWAVSFPRFYNFDFNMMDFERVGGSLARVDVAAILEGRAPQNLGPMGGIVKRPCDTFACVLNTDVSAGRGKHWVAVFGDCRGQGRWTVEYFNSAGNPPPPPVVRWQERAAARLRELRSYKPGKFGSGKVKVVTYTDVRHQDSQTECGLYALYYIRCRLEGEPLPKRRIPDEAMVEFRKHLFRES